MVTVALDEPRNPHTGGSVAAPLFARVTSAQLAHLGIITQPEPVPQETALNRTMLVRSERPKTPRNHRTAEPEANRAPRAPKRPLLEVARIGDRVFVPDFLGYSLSEVRQITAAHALELQASGLGRAVAQQPAPGTVLANDERRVHVRFRPGREQAKSEPEGRKS